jgi:hypothetical protein
VPHLSHGSVVPCGVSDFHILPCWHFQCLAGPNVCRLVLDVSNWPILPICIDRIRELQRRHVQPQHKCFLDGSVHRMSGWKCLPLGLYDVFELQRGDLQHLDQSNVGRRVPHLSHGGVVPCGSGQFHTLCSWTLFICDGPNQCVDLHACAARGFCRNWSRQFHIGASRSLLRWTRHAHTHGVCQRHLRAHARSHDVFARPTWVVRQHHGPVSRLVVPVGSVRALPWHAGVLRCTQQHVCRHAGQCQCDGVPHFHVLPDIGSDRSHSLFPGRYTQISLSLSLSLSFSLFLSLSLSFLFIVRAPGFESV